MDDEVARIEDHIRFGLELSHLLPLQTDSLENRTLRGKGMWPTALAEAPEQNLIICLQKDHTDRVSALPQGSQYVLKGATELTFSNVDDEGNAIDARCRVGAEIRYRGDQGSRKIVNAKNAEVLQGLDRLALASTRHPRDDNELHTVHI